MDENQAKLDYRDPEWVADQLGIDKNTVYKYLQDGVLPGLQLGRKWLVSERRRETVGGAQRPFALPQRNRMLDETGRENAPQT